MSRVFVGSDFRQLARDQGIDGIPIGDMFQEAERGGPYSSAKADAEFARDDLRQRGLAEAGRAYEEHVIEGVAALA